MKKKKIIGATVLSAVAFFAFGAGTVTASAATANDVACRSLIKTSDGVSTNELLVYDACRFDKLDASVKSLGTGTTNPTPSPTATPKPTTSPSPTSTPKPTPSATPSPTATPKPTVTPTPTSTPTVATSFPNAASTGVSKCPSLTKVNNGDEVAVTQPGTVIQNVEYLNPVVLNIRASDAVVRCVKFNGTGYFGIDNTVNGFSAKNTVIDQVEMSCLKKPQIVGMLLQSATVTNVNTYDCDHMVNVAGSNVTVADSFCHDLTDAEVVHADCIQDTGGQDGTTLRHNTFLSRDTSDVLLGQEGGDSKNVVIDNNFFGYSGSPKPAYMLYLSGINTVVKNNVFATNGFTYGYCTDNTRNGNTYTWTNNKTDSGQTIPSCVNRI